MKISDSDFEKLLQSEEKHSYNKTIAFQGAPEKPAGRPAFRRLAVIAVAALLAVGLIAVGIVTAAKTANHGIPTPPDVTETVPVPVTEKDTETAGTLDTKTEPADSETVADITDVQTEPDANSTGEDITDIQTDPIEETKEPVTETAEVTTNSDPSTNTEETLNVRKALLCGYSDSVSEIKKSIEYSAWNQGSYKDESRSSDITIKLGNTSISGKYLHSELMFGTNEVCHTYVDSNNNFFDVDDNNTIINYFWGNSGDSNVVKTKEECRQIAVDFIFDVSKIELTDYIEEIDYNSARKLYTFTFVKYMRDIESMDMVSVVVEENGHIYSYNSTLFGAIKENDVPVFDLADIEISVKEKLDELTKDAREKFDSVKYGNIQYQISLIDDAEYAVICTVEVNCANNIGEYEFVSGERLMFVVMI